METNTRINSDQKTIVAPENAVTFEMYKLWKSLPIAHMIRFGGKGMNKEEIAEGIATDLGITDPLFIECLTFSMQKEWAARFDLDEDTLTNWNKKIAALDPLMEAKNWANKMTKNVIFNLYRRASTSTDSFAMKLYLQVVNEWQEKNTVNIHVPDIQIVFGSMGADRSQVKAAEPVEAVASETVPTAPHGTEG